MDRVRNRTRRWFPGGAETLSGGWFAGWKHALRRSLARTLATGCPTLWPPGSPRFRPMAWMSAAQCAILVLAGAAQAKEPTAQEPLIVDRQARTVSFLAEVNPRMVGETLQHFAVWKDGRYADKALFKVFVSPARLHEALVSLGYRPGDNLTMDNWNSQRIQGDRLAVSVRFLGPLAQTAPGARGSDGAKTGADSPGGSGSDGTPPNVGSPEAPLSGPEPTDHGIQAPSSTGRNDTARDMASLVRDPGGRGLSMRFGGNLAAATGKEASGCLLCLFSCPMGIVSNDQAFYRETGWWGAVKYRASGIPAGGGLAVVTLGPGG